MPDEEKKLTPVYLNLEKHSISELELRKRKDIQKLNEIQNLEPSPVLKDNLRTQADVVDAIILEEDRQKILRGINEIDAEISKQKKEHQNEFNQKSSDEKQLTSEQERGLVSKEKTKRLRDQFVEKARGERQRDHEMER